MGLTIDYTDLDIITFVMLSGKRDVRKTGRSCRACTKNLIIIVMHFLHECPLRCVSEIIYFSDRRAALRSLASSIRLGSV